MKRVAVMQDLSCLGKCSLSVILPVISAMGVSCSVLPTAVLSTHTAFPGPVVEDLSRFAGQAMAHWDTLGAAFDGILTGYLASPEQAALALELHRRFDRGDTDLIVDPVMGDHGRRYSGIGPEMVEAMKALCGRATLILPNITEAALLTGMEYREQAGVGYCRGLARELFRLGCGSVMITGLEPEPGKIGFYWSDGNGEICHAAPKLPRSCHGTGDLFAAVVTGGVMAGMTPGDAGILAGEFVARSIAGTPEDSRWGVAFEPELGLLTNRIR
jgi:pyridoxine kinase